ncbi:MAG: SGNH/GDSL hydrolase family protein [Sporolactobacillus sp.]
MKIVCFGDSVTRGITYTRGRFRIVHDNYPALLQQALTSDKVINKGIFNDNSDLLVQRLDKDVLDQHPDIVFILIGGNDCNFRWEQVGLLPEEEHVPIVPLDRYLKNVQNIVLKIQDSGALPVILSLLPLDPVRYYGSLMKQHYSQAIGHWISLCGGIEHWHGMYNRSLAKLADKVGLTYVDLRNAFKKKGDLAELLNEDGLHPTAAGYRAMAGIILSVLPDLRRKTAQMRSTN